MSEEFKLENPKPKPPKDRFENDTRTQTVLFSGMDCLPGQQDLYQEEQENGEN